MLLGQNVRNKLINSRFDFAQRIGPYNLVNTGGGQVYNFDRWAQASFPDGGTIASGTISSVASVFPFLDQPSFKRINVSNIGTSLGANSFHVQSQPIENVRTLEGKRVTVSIWCRSDIPTKKLGLYLQQEFGVGGSAVVSVPAASGGIFTIQDNTFRRYDATFNVPSINGKVIGTGTVVLRLGITLQSGATALSALGNANIPWVATGNIDILKIQINEGAAADHEMAAEDRTRELVLCQRYFRTWPHLPVIGTSTVNIGFYVPLFPQMRAGPVGGQTGLLNIQGGSVNNTQSSPSFNVTFAGTDFVIGNSGNFTGLTNGSPYALGLPANNSNYVFFDAEY